MNGGKRKVLKKSTACQLLALAIDDVYMRVRGSDVSLGVFKEQVKSQFEEMLENETCEYIDEM